MHCHRVCRCSHPSFFFTNSGYHINHMRVVIKPGDGTGQPRDIPSRSPSRLRDDDIDAHARASAGNTIIRRVNAVLIVKLEREWKKGQKASFLCSPPSSSWNLAKPARDLHHSPSPKAKGRPGVPVQSRQCRKQGNITSYQNKCN